VYRDEGFLRWGTPLTFSASRTRNGGQGHETWRGIERLSAPSLRPSGMTVCVIQRNCR
jgi:hypothetical protein